MFGKFFSEVGELGRKERLKVAHAQIVAELTEAAVKSGLDVTPKLVENYSEVADKILERL